MSIVVACGAYNEEQYLPETIPAILAQSYADFRLLLVDNGSTDGTWRMMQQFSAQDSRIGIVRSPTNLTSGEGTHFSMDLIAKHCPDAEWVVWHGADDLMDPDYLEQLVQAAKEQPTANYIFSPWKWIGDAERGVQTFTPYNPARVAYEHQVPNWAMLKMQLWQDTGGFDRSMGAGADWDWVVRASLMQLLRPYQLPRPYLSLRVRTDRKSESDTVDFAKLFAHMRSHKPGEWAKWEQ